MNSSSTRLGMEAFVTGHPALFERYRQLVHWTTLLFRARAKANTERFDNAVREALALLDVRLADADRHFVSTVSGVDSGYRATCQQAQQDLNEKLALFLSQLTQAEAPFQEQLNQVLDELKLEKLVLENCARDLELASLRARAREDFATRSQVAIARADELRQPAREIYSRQVAEAYDVYNAALRQAAADRQLVAEPAELARKRARRSAEATKHQMTLEIAAEREDASEALIIMSAAARDQRLSMVDEFLAQMATGEQAQAAAAAQLSENLQAASLAMQAEFEQLSGAI